MRYIYTTLIIISMILTSCSSDSEDNPSVDCSDFSIEVSTFTNNYRARVQTNGGTFPFDYQWSNGETGSIIGTEEEPLDIGTYTVTVTDNNGCVLTGSITIEHLPAVIENSMYCIGADQAVVYVDVTDDGGNAITEKGVCYSTSANPTIDDTTVTVNDIYTDYITLESLSLSTTYYARGYTISSIGVSYGEELSFTTDATMPTLQVGQYYQGGIIASISCDGEYGLIVGENDYEGTWNSADTNCENMVLNGYSDWYLPSITQVKTIQDNLHTQGIGNFNTGNTIYDNYWGAPKHYDTDYACDFYAFYWDFDEDTGDALSICYHLKYRPVRNF